VVGPSRFATFCTRLPSPVLYRGEKELLVDAYGVVSLVSLSLSLQSKMDLVFLITSWCSSFFVAAVLKATQKLF
jgi:hypothetical protein